MRKKLFITASITVGLAIVITTGCKVFMQPRHMKRVSDANLSLDLDPNWKEEIRNDGLRSLERRQPFFPKRAPAFIFLHPHNECISSEIEQQAMINAENSLGARGSGPKPLHFGIATMSGNLNCVLSSMSQIESGSDPGKLFVCMSPMDGTNILYGGYKSDMPEALGMLRSVQDKTLCNSSAK